MRSHRKAAKARARHKDYVYKKNIVRAEVHAVRSGDRRGFSVDFPMSRKFAGNKEAMKVVRWRYAEARK